MADALTSPLESALSERPVRVLLVCHEGTLTGAPMNLLHFVTWLRNNTTADVHVLMVQDGPIAHRFAQVCDMTVLDRSPLTRSIGLAHRGLRRLGSRRLAPVAGRLHLAGQLRRLRGFDVVYLNSALSISVLPYLDHDGVVISHIHELDVALTTLWPGDLKLLTDAPDHFIAASGAVANVLVSELNIPADRVSTHHEFIDTDAFIVDPPSLREIERIRSSQRIPPDAAIVMGVGTVEWRKGPDLFIQLACEVRRRTREPVHFVWVGGDLTGVDMIRLHSDMRRAGADHVHFVGTQPDPRLWFAAADVLALTSREDPFPLVCLEHAAMGHPIVTYRNGGMVELLEAAGADAAFGVVDYLDVGTMAERVLTLLGDDRLRTAAASQLMERTVSHHDTSVCAPPLWRQVLSTVRR